MRYLLPIQTHHAYPSSVYHKKGFPIRPIVASSIDSLMKSPDAVELKGWLRENFPRAKLVGDHSFRDNLLSGNTEITVNLCVEFSDAREFNTFKQMME